MFVHRSIGIVQYDPPRGDMKRRTQGWCVVNVDKEITRYYRWWLRYQYHTHLFPPAWDAHISVVRGEKIDPLSQHLWKKHQGKHVEFYYKHVGEIQKTRSRLGSGPDDGKYYFIDIKCPFLDEIRQELGLRTGWLFHLTVGRTYERDK